MDELGRGLKARGQGFMTLRAAGDAGHVGFMEVVGCSGRRFELLGEF